MSLRPSLQDSYPVPSDRDIDAFENSIGFRLPDDYRTFLATVNGGVFHDEVLASDGSVVTDIYGLNTGFEWSDLAFARELTSDWVPADLLPIATTIASDQICLKEADGSIWICEHEVIEELLDIFEPVKRLAGTFTEFLKALTISEDSVSELMTGDELVDAVLLGDTERLQRAFDERVDADYRSSEGKTLLIYAASRARVAVIDLLISKGASLSATDSRGYTAIFHAVFGDCVDTVALLVRRGADVNSIDRHGRPVLIEALSRNALRSALKLIELGAHVNAQSSSGETALGLCSSDDDARKYVLPTLLAAGAKE